MAAFFRSWAFVHAVAAIAAWVGVAAYDPAAKVSDDPGYLLQWATLCAAAGWLAAAFVRFALVRRS